MTVFERMNAIRARQREMANTLRTENRDMTDAEREEMNALRREHDWLELEMRGAQHTTQQPAQERALYTAYRNLAQGNNARADLCARSAGDTANAQIVAGGLQPVATQEILMPIHEALIWDKVGIRVPNVPSGAPEWPVVNTLEAEFAGETAEGAGQKVDLGKVNLTQQRLTAVAKVSRSAVINSNNAIQDVIGQLIPDAAAVAINKVLFSTTKPAGANIQGPFVGLTAKTLSAVFGNTTFKEFNTIKAALLAKGYSSQYLCWVMSESTKAELEATPIDAGSGIMCVVNDKLCGLPVYCSEFIGTDYVGLGDWRYYALSQSGPVSFIVDPVTEATKDTIRNVYNTLYNAGVLRADAFVLVKKKTTA